VNVGYDVVLVATKFIPKGTEVLRNLKTYFAFFPTSDATPPRGREHVLRGGWS